MVRLGLVVVTLAVSVACIRPTDSYEVAVYGEGTGFDDVLPAPEPMGGLIEVVRYRLWGTNLGHGLTGLFGDWPRQDGHTFLVGSASFGYPADPGYDRNTLLVMPGPPVGGNEDACITRVGSPGFPGISEYVDVGDRVQLTTDDGARLVLPRDPATYPRPAGEAWFVGYGDRLLPAVTGHPTLPDTWRPGTVWDLHLPGALQPPEATFGAIPYPVDASLVTPYDVDGLFVNGQEVRAPHHGYDNDGFWDPTFVDDVRFAGPFDAPMTVQWTPSPTGDPVTITVRYLAAGAEFECDCSTDCGEGFSCLEGWCTPDEGSGWAPLGEVSCTVADDGEFELRPGQLEALNLYAPPEEIGGAILLVSRISQDTVRVPDVLTWNGRRVPVGEVRTRATDVVVTRLGLQ